MRKVHLRYPSVVNLGRSATFCGRTIYGAPEDMSGAVVTFRGFNSAIDATVHGTLVTCSRCLVGAHHARQP